MDTDDSDLFSLPTIYFGLQSSGLRIECNLKQFGLPGVMEESFRGSKVNLKGIVHIDDAIITCLNQNLPTFSILDDNASVAARLQQWTP